MARAYPETTYERWIREQGLPVVGGYGIEDVLDLPRAPWARLGGRGTFIKLEGMEGVTGMYVAEIPPGGALNPEKHLYEEIMYVLHGRGTAEVSEPKSDARTMFEWNKGSLFTMPLNTQHRLLNGSGAEPAILLGFTNAPLVLDLFHRPDFVFSSDYSFDDRFDGGQSFFATGDHRFKKPRGATFTWETNFVPDVRAANLDPAEYKAPERLSTTVQMNGGILVSHIAQWPSGRQDKAHYHGGGAVLLALNGQGYSLMWPSEAGIRPYEAGNGDKVVRANWRDGSVFSPPSGWFHQHFNSSGESARHLAFRYGGQEYGVEFQDILRKGGTHVNVRQGGTLVEYEDQDPEIGRAFAAECAANGVQVRAPVVSAA